MYSVIDHTAISALNRHVEYLEIPRIDNIGGRYSLKMYIPYSYMYMCHNMQLIFFYFFLPAFAQQSRLFFLCGNVRCVAGYDCVTPSYPTVISFESAKQNSSLQFTRKMGTLIIRVIFSDTSRGLGFSMSCPPSVRMRALAFAQRQRCRPVGTS